MKKSEPKKKPSQRVPVSSGHAPVSNNEAVVAIDPKTERSLLAYLARKLGRKPLNFSTAPYLIASGTEATIIGFSLAGVGRSLGPLVLRLSVDPDYPLQPALEHAVHQALVKQAFPAPPVYFYSTDGDELERPFLIMGDMTRPQPERLRFKQWIRRFKALVGRSQLPRNDEGVGGNVSQAELLMKTLAQLHSLDGIPLLRAFKKMDASESARAGLRRYQQTHEIAEKWHLYPLQPLLGWLRENRPSLRRPVICHGDPHVGNLIIKGSRVNAMVDWSGAQLGAAEADLGLICGCRRCNEEVESWKNVSNLDRDLLDSYGRYRNFDESLIRYYEAELLISYMASVGDQKQRQIAGMDPPPNPILDNPHTMIRLGTRLRQLVPDDVPVPMSWD